MELKPFGMPWQAGRRRAGTIVATAYVALVCIAASARGDEAIGVIDTYGVGNLDRDAILTAASLKVGDGVPVSTDAIVQRLKSLPGVARAAVHVVRVQVAAANDRRDKMVVVYIGIDDGTLPHAPHRFAPTGDLELTPDIVAAYQDFEAALAKAFESGAAGNEDFSSGHSLMSDPTTRAAQERFIPLANAHREQLIQVLKTARDAKQRAMAAWIVAYASDKRVAAAALVDAVRDPDGVVRNNALRALGGLAGYGQRHPEVMIEIPDALWIDLLNSLVWTDRNKILFVLGELTRDRNSALLKALSARAGPTLAEMARWKYEGHALMPLLLLGRMAGLDDADVLAAWRKGEQERIIDLGMQSKPGR